AVVVASPAPGARVPPRQPRGQPVRPGRPPRRRAADRLDARQPARVGRHGRSAGRPGRAPADAAQPDPERRDATRSGAGRQPARTGRAAALAVGPGPDPDLSGPRRAAETLRRGLNPPPAGQLWITIGVVRLTSRPRTA